MSDLDKLIEKNKKLKSLYEGKDVDLKRDSKRSAKPRGYRFVGKHDYRVPTAEQIKRGKKRGTIDYENRANRADVYPKGSKGEMRGVKLEKGGMADDKLKINDGENVWYLTYIDSTHFFLSNSPDFKGNPYHIGQFRSEPYYDEVDSWLKSHKGMMSHGGYMAKGGMVGTIQVLNKKKIGTTEYEVVRENITESQNDRIKRIINDRDSIKGDLSYQIDIKYQPKGDSKSSVNEYAFKKIMDVLEGGYMADGGMMAKGGYMADGGTTMAKGGKVKRSKEDIKKDEQRFAKPAGWRWKNSAVDAGIITKSQLGKTPSAKMRKEHPDYVQYEDRATKSDKRPSRKFKSL
jgi:hypothetical protein